jgi:hypothetical protein
MSSTTNSTLRDKLTNVPLISYIDEELYMKLLITKNNQTQIGLYTKVPNRRDKHLYWVSADEADILSKLGIQLVN